jgi:hypothetical protein
MRNLYRGPSIDASYQVSYHLAKRFQRRWKAPMEGSVLSFLKAEWKVTDTGSAQCWASSFSLIFVRQIIMNWKFGNNNQIYPILIDWLMFGILTFLWHIFNTYSGRERNSLIYKYYIKMRTLRIFTWQFSSQRYIDINWTRDGFQFSIDNPYIVLTTVADIDTLSIENCQVKIRKVRIFI